MSPARISILFVGLIAILLLGSWAWVELVTIAYKSGTNEFLVALTVYGVAGLVLATVAGYTFFVLWFRNSGRG
jgi:hypothetical protein